MNRQTSVYLDAVRFAAAMTVFLGHISGRRFTAGLLYQFGPFMGDAVIVFFVLSGFVIGYVVDQREATATDFVVARAARIYSVALPAIAATLILDQIGRSIRPDFYSDWWGYSGEHLVWKTLGAIFFTNLLWFSDASMGSMLPYWSLCYEVWYYIIFGVATFAPRPIRLIATPLLLLVVGPRIAALFPIWLAGLGAYQLSIGGKLGRHAGAAIFIGSIAGFWTWELWGRAHGFPQLRSPILNRPGLLNDYVVGGLMAVNIVGIGAWKPSLGALGARLSPIVRWCAGATFTIYLFHLPIAQFLTTVTPWPPTAWPTRLMMFGGVLVVMFAIAEVTERRKDVWRRLFSRVALFWSRPRTPQPAGGDIAA